MRSGRATRAGAVAALFTAILASQLVLSRPILGPIILYDELAHLGTAAWFAGIDWSEWLRGPTVRAVPAGYPLLLLPAFLWLEEPAAIYRYAQVVNALFAAGIFPVAFALGRRLAGTRHPAFLLLVSGAVALYPSVRIYASLAWTEAALALLYWLSVLIVSFVARRDDARVAWVALALVLVAMHAIHVRSTTAMAAAVVIAVWLARIRYASPGVLATFGAIVVLGLSVNVVVGEWLDRAFWAGEVRSYLDGKDLGFPVDRILRWGGAAAGQAWYLGVATFLTGFAGFFVAARTTLRSWLRQTPATEELRLSVVSAYVTVSVAAQFVASTIYLHDLPRADAAVYGRYNETVVGPLILFGMLFVERLRRRSVVALAGSLLLLGWIASTLAPDLERASMAATAVTGVSVFFDGAWRIHPVPAGCFAVVLALPLLLVSRRHPPFAPLVLAIVWTAVAIANVRGPVARAAEDVRSVAALSRWFPANAAGGSVAFDTAGDWRLTKVGGRLQFWLGRTRLQRTGSEAPQTAYVITGDATLAERVPRPSLVAIDPVNALNLWVIDSAERARLERAGRIPNDLVPYPERRRLPDAAYRSRIETIGRSDIAIPSAAGPKRWLQSAAGGLELLHAVLGPSAVVPVRIAHAGAGAAWPPSVRVGVVWIAASQRGRRVAEQAFPMPARLRPGDEAVLRLELRPRAYDGSLLADGEYRVRIGLVHERVGWFESRGDPVAEVRVVVGRDAGAAFANSRHGR